MKFLDDEQLEYIFKIIEEAHSTETDILESIKQLKIHVKNQKMQIKRLQNIENNKIVYSNILKEINTLKEKESIKHFLKVINDKAVIAALQNRLNEIERNLINREGM